MTSELDSSLAILIDENEANKKALIVANQRIARLHSKMIAYKEVIRKLKRELEEKENERNAKSDN